MILTEPDIIEYQGLVLNRYGIKISKAEATEDAMKLINFVSAGIRQCKKGLKDEASKDAGA